MTGVDADVEETGAERRPVWPWLALLLLAAFLDGLVGIGVVVVAASLWIARIQLRWLVALGCACLAAVPAVVIAAGLPSAEEVSPDFVMRSTLPHHLTFAGLMLIGIWAMIDLAPHLVREPAHADRPGGEDTDGRSSGALGTGVVAYVVVGVVAVAAIAASLAVLQQ